MEKVFDLRLFRKANAITQSALAEYLGVTKQFISQVESGKYPLPTDKVKKILDNPDWSREKYFDLVQTLEEMKRSAGVRLDSDVTVGDGDAILRVPLLPVFAQAGNKVTAIYIKRDMRKVDEANRKVIDYINGRPASHDAGRPT